MGSLWSKKSVLHFFHVEGNAFCTDVLWLWQVRRGWSGPGDGRDDFGENGCFAHAAWQDSNYQLAMRVCCVSCERPPFQRGSE
ncbi:MAG: hypothetical protein EA381_00860 [Planctomycetaceae bacterium]|nr:MAG: hypothetical protein EA381_00860 [Planctomycetaceae bacterium]